VLRVPIRTALISGLWSFSWVRFSLMRPSKRINSRLYLQTM
jgi:hypothetical protein